MTEAVAPAPVAAAPPPLQPPYDSPRYRWYVATVMAIIFGCHALDRGMPNILIEPVRHEFNLSDGELGLYSGVAFGLSFGVFVLPLGYLSDRTNRRNLLAGLLVAWSVLTTLGAFARNFGQLVALRFGVGAAEAGGAPIVLPFITSIMPPDKRSLSMGFVYTGAAIGNFLAISAGGYVAEHHGWRSALLLAGLPGLVLAVLLLTTVKEPPRSSSGGVTEKPPKFTDVIGFLIAKPALLSLILGCSSIALAGIAIGAWMGSFFIRVHGLSLTEVGLILGLGTSLCAVFAPPLWGWLGGVVAKRARHWPLTITAFNCVLAFLLNGAMLFTPSVALAIGCTVVGTFLLAGYSPLTYTALLEETPERMRGTVMSILQLGSNLAGFGLGPVVIGILSDRFGGGAAIRYALANALAIYLIAGVLVGLAAYFLFRPAGVRTAPASA